MSEPYSTRIIIHDSRSISYYTEQETAEHSHLTVETVRRLHAAGMIDGIEVAGEERRYSEQDVVQLRRIRRLQHDLGINLAGAEIILRLCERLEKIQNELEQYKAGLPGRREPMP